MPKHSRSHSSTMASFSSSAKWRRLARPSRPEQDAGTSVMSLSVPDFFAALLAQLPIFGRALRMKMRPSVHFACIEETAPSPQPVPRQVMYLGAGQYTHSKPSHRLDMHRPERLNHLRTHASGQSNASLTTTLASFFKQNFGPHLLNFCDTRGFPPTDERHLGKSMLRAVATLR
jgi:hypothetical protein